MASGCYNRGGQRRTIEAGCGYRIVGHPQEVNAKFSRHKKYCINCKNLNIETNTTNNDIVLPKFDKDAGTMNGWKGRHINGHKPTKMKTTAFINGVRQDVIVCEDNLESAMDTTRLMDRVLCGLDEDLEQSNFIKKLIFIKNERLCETEIDKYSVSEINKMTKPKLKILVKLCEKQVDDFIDEYMDELKDENKERVRKYT
jgi:hypothetical protein